MAEKRMFSKSVVASSDFMNLKTSARELYFQLGLQADDDGFLNNAEYIRRMVGAKKSDYIALVENGYLINIRPGLDVIRHWNVNNTLRSDRYKSTIYQSEKDTLRLVGGRYERVENEVCNA